MPEIVAPVRMKVTEVRSVPLRLVRTAGSVTPAWSPDRDMTFNVGGGAFVEIHTDQGLIGIGPHVSETFLPAVRDYLIGKDPFDVERHAHALRYYVRGTPYNGTAGIDIALWDLIGKACGQPLYRLWGGGKDVTTPYVSTILLGTPEERAAFAEARAGEGWKAIKLRIHHDAMAEDLRTVERVMAAVGDRMAVMVDANQAQSSGTWQPGILWDFRRAMETAFALDEMGVAWFEEPLPRYRYDQIAEMCGKVEMPIAGGENNPGLHEFVDMAANGVYDLWQPESMVMDGVTALRKVGTLAELRGKQIVPHHGGGNLGVIANMHLVASWPHAPYLELLHEPPIGDYRHGFAMLANAPEVKDGLLRVPQGPGLGVEIDPDMIAR